MKNVTYKIFVCFILGLAVFCASCQPKPQEEKKQNSEIGVIDKSAIMKMAAFKKANEKIAVAIQELEKSYSQQMKGASQEQQQELYARFRQESEMVRNKDLNVLMGRVQSAIEIVAKEKNLKVVLDKSIVVTGSEDITEDVKEKFRAEGDLPAAQGNIGDSSVVGYFDQDVVRTLQIFRDGEKKMQAEFENARKDVAKRSASLSKEKQQELIASYDRQLEAKRAAIMSPLFDKVTFTVKSVAEKENMVLILDKQYVMYGGRNVTDKVVESLNGSSAGSSK